MPAMFNPLECFIGLRYVWSRRRRGVISFMSGASLLGIALGVAALIVILSVMNGLETEARVRLLSLSAHAELTGGDAGLGDWQALRDSIARKPGVAGVSPYVALEGMLAAGSRLYPVIVRGISPQQEYDFESIAALAESGSFDSLAGPEQSIAIGRALALNLAVAVGDRLNLLFARIVDGRPRPTLVPFTVGAIFSAGIAEHDSSLALINIHDASRIKNLDGHPEGLAITLQDPLEVAKFRDSIDTDRSLADYGYSDWTVQHRSHFRAIQIEKMMMSVILMLIVGVAAFNIVASLMMVVTDKRKDIAILRTCGLEPSRVARIFLFQGSIIGFTGTLLGAGLGLVLAFNVETIVPWLERTFDFKIMPGDVYYVTEIPSEIHGLDVVLICVFACLVAILATVYPSRRAARIAPAEALRYE
jgi:lipoprotein-releasing system permease protein